MVEVLLLEDSGSYTKTFQGYSVKINKVKTDGHTLFLMNPATHVHKPSRQRRELKNVNLD